MASFHDFPKDVWMEIMVRLPPESLKRFKRVCNSWNALINALIRDPEFVAKHLRNMKTKSVSSPSLCFRDLYAVSSPDFQEGDGSDIIYLLTVIDGEDCDSCDYIPCVDYGFRYLYGNQKGVKVKVVSQCNGVICFHAWASNGQDFVFLVNPSLRELKAILNPIPNYDDDDDDDDDDELVAMGFGYDSGADDYKVVAIRHDRFKPFKAGVYSLSTNTWKEIKCDLILASSTLYDGQSIYCNGVCYWFCVGACKIVSFDLHGEVFRDIPYPGVVTSRSTRVLDKITVWNESLALFSYSEVDMLVIDMLVLDSKSGEGSCLWIKHMTIGPLPYFGHPETFMLDGELLLLRTEGNRAVVSYNLRTRELGDFFKHLQGGPFTDIVPSTKSLVSVLKNRG